MDSVEPAKQRVIDPDLAKLVDDHRCPVHSGMAQQRAEQGAFAAAQKTRNDRDRYTSGKGIPTTSAWAHSVISST
jgi:hypothetical protein